MEVGEWVTEQSHISKYSNNCPSMSNNYQQSNTSSVSDLSEHKISVLNKNNLNILPLRCDFCDYRCKLFIQLKLHQNIHLKKENVGLDNCEKKTVKNLEKSLKIVTLDNVDSRIICDVCNYECFFVIQLMIHKRVRHGDGASFLTYVDKDLLVDDKFEKAILYYFIKKPKIIVDRKSAVGIQKLKDRNPTGLKIDELVKGGRKKVACKYCKFTCQYLIQLKVHKKRLHGKRRRKTLISPPDSKEDEDFQSANADKTRNEINAIDCNIANEEIHKIQEEKGGTDKESSEKKSEVKNIDVTTEAVSCEANKENYTVPQNTTELSKKKNWKLEKLACRNEKKLNFNYQSSKKRKKKARHEHDRKLDKIKKEEKCSKVQNVTTCKVKENDIQLYTSKPSTQDSSKKSKNCNLKFSCSHCTFKCKFSVELRIHENIHRTKTFVIRPVTLSSYSDNIAYRFQKCVIKDKDFDTNEDNQGGLKLVEISRDDPVMKTKNKEIHSDVAEKQVLEKINSTKVVGRLSITDSMLSCSDCNYKCNFEEQLRMHKSVLHEKDASLNKSLDVKLKPIIKCYIKLQDYNKFAVKSHTSKEKEQKSMTDYSVTCDERKLFCNYCNFKCTLPIQLSVHKNIHVAEEKLGKNCDKDVPKVVKSDRGKKIVTVADWKKRQSSKSSFGTDIRMNFPCSTCNYTFSTQETLIKHKSYHSGRNCFAF